MNADRGRPHHKPGAPATGPELDDPRVIAALDEYVAALEAGRKPDRQAFLGRHAEVAGALAACLDGMEALHEASSPTHPPALGGILSADWQPGTPLGDFRILREVGRGGMGVVYEAEQLSLGRRIALKVLPLALTLDPRQLQRFKNEARAAAQLHHPHIVPVYFVGSERGVHFYAMQYIEGQSLAEMIQSLRQGGSGEPSRTPDVARRAGAEGAASRAAPTRGESTDPYLPRPAASGSMLSETLGVLATAQSSSRTPFYRAVARLGMQAAEGLEHAHQYGVVHRDVKPGNLLLDTGGQVWITDFGLAQFQTDAGLTQTGDLLGTLRYMSPEQAGGQRIGLDHRTDVYSLGATLYELLTLRPPFDGADRQRLLRQILEDEPRPLRAVVKTIPAELETIVLKAMAKAPAERYATARELADDLSRFLEHQPIRARRATLAQRGRKWARRHPSAIVAAVVLCVLTAIGSLVSAGMIGREEMKTKAAYQREKERAQEAKERAQEAKERAQEAEKHFQLAKEWVDDTFNVCEEETAGNPMLDGLRRRLLEHALGYYQKLIAERGDADDKGVLAANLERVQHILDDLAVMQGDRLVPLLDEPAVLDDLRLSGERRKEITAMMHSRGERFRKLLWKPVPLEEKRPDLLALARDSEAAVEKILTREQLGRLRQINLQRQGTRAFEDPEVSTTLKLTAAQREKIRLIAYETFRTFSGGPRGFGPKPGKSPDPPPDPMDRIVKTVLTAEQAQQWQKLTGEKGPPPPAPPWLWRDHRGPQRDHHGPPPVGPAGLRPDPGIPPPN
jgi:serine/threonine protein kinase